MLAKTDKTIVLGVTSQASVVFFEKVLATLRAQGMRPILVSSPGDGLRLVAREQHAASIGIAMERDIAPWQDLRALVHLCALFKTLRPAMIDFGTPKAGLLGMLAGWITFVPCRVYTLRGLRLESTVGWKRRLLMTTEWISCKCAHRVICVSPSLRQRAIDLGLLKREKAVVLGSGTCNDIEVDRFLPTRENLARAEECRQRLELRLVLL